MVQAEVASTGFVGLRPLGTNDAVNTAPNLDVVRVHQDEILMKGVLAVGTAVAFGADAARDEPEATPTPTPDPADDASTRSSYEIVWKDTAGGVKTQLCPGGFEGWRLNATPTRLSTSGNRSGRGPRLRWRDPSTHTAQARGV